MKILDATFMQMAREAGQRSNCTGLKQGCVLVDQTGTPISTGWVGVAPGMPHCNHAPGEPCLRVTHSEANALIFKGAARPATAYLTHFPCLACVKLLALSGVRRIVTPSIEKALLPDADEARAIHEWLSHNSILTETCDA